MAFSRLPHSAPRSVPSPSRPSWARALGALALACPLVLAAGCGDDSAGSSSGGGSGTAGSGSGATSGTASASGGTSAGTASASGGSSGSAGSSGSTGGVVTEVNLFGDVRDYVLDAIIPNAAISVYDDANLMTTADDMGVYQLGPFTPGDETFIMVADDTSYWGSVIPVIIGNEADQEQPLAQISREFVQAQQDLLADQMPVAHDPTTAFILARVIQNSAIMEGPVTLTLDPPPVPGTFYAPDANGSPTLNLSEATWDLLPAVIYYNIDPQPPGGYTITATHPVRTCTVESPQFPTVGAHITLVNIDCPPAG